MRAVTWMVVAAVGAQLGAATSAAQERELLGRVLTQEVGVPWAGAAVTVPGTGVLVCADGDGRFRLSVPEAESTRVVVQPVGFPAVELTVRPADDEMLIPMRSHVVHLEGVVVTVYAESLPPGTPYAVSEVSGEDLNRVPGDLPRSLEGKVPGAVLTHDSGAPGGGFQLSMRGVRTVLGNTEPLIVVDGVPVSSARIGSGSGVLTGSGPDEEEASGRLADLNPMDIARVEVLKGVAAAQRFGSRAANGVVVITTHSGTLAAPDEDDAPDPSLACWLPVG